MKQIILNFELCKKYKEDIYTCFIRNKKVFDSQNPYAVKNANQAFNYIMSFVDAPDALVYGIVSNDDAFLYGIVILEHIRSITRTTAQVHILTDKILWGSPLRKIYETMLQSLYADTLYCEIPSNATFAIGVAKHLGFKKTGYIPEALPYIDKNGNERFYDLLIYTFRKEKGLLERRNDNG